MNTKAGFDRKRFNEGEKRIARIKNIPAKAPIYLST